MKVLVLFAVVALGAAKPQFLVNTPLVTLKTSDAAKPVVSTYTVPTYPWNTGFPYTTYSPFSSYNPFYNPLQFTTFVPNPPKAAEEEKPAGVSRAKRDAEPDPQFIYRVGNTPAFTTYTAGVVPSTGAIPNTYTIPSIYNFPGTPGFLPSTYTIPSTSSGAILQHSPYTYPFSGLNPFFPFYNTVAAPKKDEAEPSRTKREADPQLLLSGASTGHVLPYNFVYPTVNTNTVSAATNFPKLATNPLYYNYPSTYIYGK